MYLYIYFKCLPFMGRYQVTEPTRPSSLHFNITPGSNRAT